MDIKRVTILREARAKKVLNCVECLFARESRAQILYCHLNEPRLPKPPEKDGGYSSMQGEWPRVERTDFCGQWIPKP